MSVHLIDEDQLLQMTRVFQSYEESFSNTFLDKKSQLNEEMETTIQDELRQACIYIGDKQAFGKQITSKALEIFSNVRATLISKSQKIGLLENKVQELERYTNSLQATLKLLEQQNQSSEHTMKTLRDKIRELEKGIDQNEKNTENDKKTIQESLHAFSQLTQTSIMKQKLLNNENEKRGMEINQYKMQIEAQKYQIAGHLQQTQELRKNIINYNNKITNIEQQRSQLLTKISSLESRIQSLEDQIKQNKHIRKYSKYSDREEDFILGERQSVILQVKNLNDEFKQTQIIFEQDVFAYTNQVIQKANTMHNLDYKQKNQNEVKKQTGEKKQNNQDNINRMMIDPYYAHFILTSQSVKIRLEHDQFLGIDFQKYYKEVMESCIQMHHWPQWIEKKLKEIMSN